MPASVRYLDLGDFLVIAEDLLGIEAETLTHLCDLHLADSALNAPSAGFGEIEFHPDFAMKAAVLCWHVIKNHSLPDGNKRMGYLCLREFVERNHHDWCPVPDDPGGDLTVAVMVGIADGSVSVEQLAVWVRERMEG